MVLERLREYKLYANLSKYIFYTTSINFLGFIISINRVLINKSWMDAIKEWPYPIIFIIKKKKKKYRYS